MQKNNFALLGGIKMKYPKKYPREWETVNNYTDRLKVPGGWLVSRSLPDRSGVATSICFISDKYHHSWKLEKEK